VSFQVLKKGGGDGRRDVKGWMEIKRKMKRGSLRR
jgi:hypothetical protein